MASKRVRSWWTVAGALCALSLAVCSCARGSATRSVATTVPAPAVTLLPSPIPTGTPLPQTPASAEQATSTPGPTPDWTRIDPESPSTWPQWAQDYWSGPAGASSDQDARFDVFLAQARRANLGKLLNENAEILRVLLFHLAKSGLTGSLSADRVSGLDSAALRTAVNHLGNQELLAAEIIYQAQQQRPVLLSPDEIRTLQGDPWAGISYWADNEKKQTYGFWSGLGATSPATDLTSFVARLRGDTYHATLFGRETVVHRDAMWSPSFFDFAGIVELPGGQGDALLGRFRTEDKGDNVFQLFALLPGPQAGGATPGCQAILFPGPQLTSCPAITFPASGYALGAHNYDWQPANLQDLSRSLHWPPVLIAASPKDMLGTDPTTGKLTNYDGFLLNGLEMIGTFNIFQTSDGQNPE